jgi:hypothetical protein
VLDAMEVVMSGGGECGGDGEFKPEVVAEDNEEGAFKSKDMAALPADYVVRELEQETREDVYGSAGH